MSETPLIKYVEEMEKSIGPRITGSPEEFAAGEYIREKFKKFGIKEIENEEFKVCPRALQNLVNFMAIGYLIGLILYPILPYVSAFLVLVLILFFILVRFANIGLNDLLSERRPAQNVIGTIGPEESKSKEDEGRNSQRNWPLLIFSGHLDSAYSMPLLGLGHKRVKVIQDGCIASIILLLPLSIWRAITFFIPETGIGELLSKDSHFFQVPIYWLPDGLYILPLIGLVLILIFKFTIVTNEPVLGANDNLSSLAVLIGIARYLGNNPPKRTEIRLIAFAGEEPGMKGSKDYINRHLPELKGAININFEIVGVGVPVVIKKEKDNRIVHSSRAVDLVVKAGEKAKLKVTPMDLEYGNSDASSFTRKNIDATTIGAWDEELALLWHSPKDRAELLEEEALQKVLKLSITIIELIDSEENLP